jgi:hypothetical protein
VVVSLAGDARLMEDEEREREPLGRDFVRFLIVKEGAESSSSILCNLRRER